MLRWHQHSAGAEKPAALSLGEIVFVFHGIVRGMAATGRSIRGVALSTTSYARATSGSCYNAYRRMEPSMIADITLHREELRELCSRFHVRRLDVFGSAARGDFDPARSDLDFLVEFASQDDDLACFLDFKQALEALLARRVDLVDRKAIESSRNYIRKRHILTGAEPVYAA
jgi:predicted nucleotidyltransferase